MTYQTPNQTHPPAEYTAALNHLRDTFSLLFEVVNTYPEARREESGACGWWSPRQVLAHLSGWIEEGIRRFHAFDAGVREGVQYDDDAFNAHSVETRKDYDWQQTFDELRSSFQNLIALASKIDPERAAEDPRYKNWLRGLAADCEEHTQQLQAFIQE